MRDELNGLPLHKLFDTLCSEDELVVLIDRARHEDMGQAGDITSRVAIEAGSRASAQVRSRVDGVVCGLRLLSLIALHYDDDLAVNLHASDGDRVGAGQGVATVTGALRSLLAAERVMLNFVCHLSGIATMTAKYVDVVAGTKAKIYDTRKTIPGLRHLAKYAVRCGGGRCHRVGLHDAVLIKDNHLHGLTGGSLADKVRGAVERAKADEPAFVEVEVDTLEQLEDVVGCGVDIVLLDNMSPDQLRQAVAVRDTLAPDVELEASGGVTLETVRGAAETGVDRIAIGALTHSAPSLDLGMDIVVE